MNPCSHVAAHLYPHLVPGPRGTQIVAEGFLFILPIFKVFPMNRVSRPLFRDSPSHFLRERSLHGAHVEHSLLQGRSTGPRNL